MNKKTYKETLEKLNSIKSANDTSSFDKAFYEFENFVKNISFNSYVNGWITEKDELIDNLLYFLKRKEIKKSKYISWILNTYYKGSIDGLFNEMLENEEYELLENFKDLKDTTEMPHYLNFID